MIILKRMPLPPSSNHQYCSFIQRGRLRTVPTKELALYKRLFAAWQRLHESELSAHRLTIKPDQLICARAYFFLSHPTIFTKDGRPKRMDVSNRIKALHDLVSEALGIDDKQFFSISAEKVLTEESNEWVTMELFPMEVTTQQRWENVRRPWLTGAGLSSLGNYAKASSLEMYS